MSEIKKRTARDVIDSINSAKTEAVGLFEEMVKRCPNGFSGYVPSDPLGDFIEKHAPLKLQCDDVYIVGITKNGRVAYAIAGEKEVKQGSIEEFDTSVIPYVVLRLTEMFPTD